MTNLNIAIKTFSLFVFFTICSKAQTKVSQIENLREITTLESGIHNYWLNMGSNTYGQPFLIPVIVIQGKKPGPTLGLTAAIHGNELNGILIIHELVGSVNIEILKGRIIAIPGLNAISIQLDQRRFTDDEDLNRNFPGKKNGNNSQQYAFKIKERVLPVFDFHIDMHTASFGRTNTLYARADASNDTIRKMAELQGADIILNGKGMPSFGDISTSTRTMRGETVINGAPSITVEYGNPQVFQKDIITRGLKGVFNTLKWLNMYEGIIEKSDNPTTYCKKSYWIYMDEGGFLDVLVELNERIQKGQKIAIVRHAFGNILKEYFAPEEGIVIGKSTNPTNMSGGRIIHLGIFE